MPTENPGAILHLTAGGVSVVLDATDGQLPAIVHWGEQLPVLTSEEARTMVGARTPVTGSRPSTSRPGLASCLGRTQAGWGAQDYVGPSTALGGHRNSGSTLWP